MKLSKFKFDLPEKLIAQYPAENRESSKLMVLDRKAHTIEHKVFSDLW
ncbi:MAG: S-adenosylmethionine:tRNA ribosyltransferase-isomerase, partial [Bacteroidales bacterium]|nr:S-adenosylmethionine:tRNA ribosyltransferase-isomerase [Bacteroidales bacterium]